MTTRAKILIGILIVLISYAFGRFSAPAKIKTVEVEKKVYVKDTNTQDHKTTIIVQRPDGTKTTTITDDKDTQSTTKESDNKVSEKEITRDTGKVTVAGLVSVNVVKPGLPDYGALISKPVLGPITVGIFGFKLGIVGAAVGLTF